MIFYVLYDKSPPLAQWENVVEMQLENRLWPTWQMNHNWVWNFSKPLILTSSLINENQRKRVAGMTQRPSAHVCWWNLQGAVWRRVQLMSILKSETKAWSQLLCSLLVWPWPRYFTSLSLHFLIYKMGLVVTQQIFTECLEWTSNYLISASSGQNR